MNRLQATQPQVGKLARRAFIGGLRGDAEQAKRGAIAAHKIRRADRQRLARGIAGERLAQQGGAALASDARCADVDRQAQRIPAADARAYEALVEHELAVISGRADSVALVEQLMAQFGEEPDAWLPVFRAQRETKR